MDLTTVIGLLAGLALIFVGGGVKNLTLFFDLHAAFIVFGGTVCALLVGYPGELLKGLMAALGKTVFVKRIHLGERVEQMVSFATVARRDGLLALESRLQEVQDPFLLRGLQLIIDGVPPESVRNILEVDVAQMATRHNHGKSMMDAAANYGPAFGMVGTLLGLVVMLRNLSDPSSLGPSMSVALVATFYGAVQANMIAQPLANKMSERNAEEVIARQLMIEGILAIQAGENPSVIHERLQGFLPPSERKGRPGREEGGERK